MTNPGAGSGTVGVISEPDHPVFGPVSDRLRRQGFDVRCFEPGRDVDHAAIDGLAVLVNKKIRPASFRALHYADRVGVPTWNGFAASVLLTSRLNALCALDAAGCRTPPVHFEPPAGDYVAKRSWGWQGPPELNGEGDFYQERVRAEPVDHKYYAVDDGTTRHVRVLAVRSKLLGPMTVLGSREPAAGPAAAVRRLMELTGVRGIGVDFVRDEDGAHYAVDANVAPSFRQAGLEDALAASIAAVTRSSG